MLLSIGFVEITFKSVYIKKRGIFVVNSGKPIRAPKRMNELNSLPKKNIDANTAKWEKILAL